MFRKVLVANRGAIACRIFRTLKKMGVGSVAVYSEAERHSLHVDQADEAVLIGPAAAAQSYLSIPSILDATERTGAEAIHPGYGFLSENAEFAEACAARGIVFIGPTPEQMRAFGLKHTARRIAEENNVALLPGSVLLPTIEGAVAAAERVGYPVMLKSTAGGGGIGMRLCMSASELAESYAAVQRTSQASFGSAALYLEKFVSHARHIEVQIFGDGTDVIALGERDCSAQRRNQKVIEETPAPGISDATRQELFECAVRLGRAVGYRSAGTVEFIYDEDSRQFYFLEVNTRLQVEHGVTEEVTGVDLVECMVLVASGGQVGNLPHFAHLADGRGGCSIQVRVYAEDPYKNFQPGAGRLTHVVWPAGARVETWVEAGSEVTPYYDPMLAKIIVHGADRDDALAKMRAALAECSVAGIETNVEYLRQVCADPRFAAGGVTTSFLKGFDYRSRAMDVMEPGTQSTVQDYPGRLGYWHVGVPPSGPMDSLAFRIANELVGNREDAAGLEIAVTGPALRFRFDASIAVTGADFSARLDGVAVPLWEAVSVQKGSLLEFGTGGGRAYLSVAGGFDVPLYLGSRSTFILGKFGGHAGRALRAGDVLAVGEESRLKVGCSQEWPPYKIGNEWEIKALYGPHGAPDFFTAEDIEMFFSTSWKVHYNSDRTGVRLIGPKPVWARKDGGEAGLHPSNLHDNAYAIGTVDFTGDMPVILGPDGPSLGGFVCPATIIHDELWKMGQLKPGDTVRFRAVSMEGPVLRRGSGIAVRADGDRNLLVEYGPMVLDLNLRLRVHALETALRAAALPGIIDITAGVRSLQVHYDTRISREELLAALDECEGRIPSLDDIVVPSRVVHLPLSWEDPATLLAIQKYMQSVRADAPWCPSNIEFIRRINGLASIEDVKQIVFDANYLVLGLGDVYLGAPVATPTDPRHRLVTTKYNPARTWTPENAVGIGGAYMCVYGMEGPGGYQFVGRTAQVWSTYRRGQVGDQPYLLRHFDQIRFHPVSAEELLEIRDAFPQGRYALQIEDAEFRLKDHQYDATEWKRRQQQAFLEERDRWGAEKIVEAGEVASIVEDAVAQGCRAVSSPVTASVWSIGIERGQRVEAGQRLIVLEAMKMEIAVTTPVAGVVEKVDCAVGALVSAGQRLVTIRI
jgi:urea carboxylase